MAEGPDGWDWERKPLIRDQPVIDQSINSMQAQFQGQVTYAGPQINLQHRLQLAPFDLGQMGPGIGFSPQGPYRAYPAAHQWYQQESAPGPSRHQWEPGWPSSVPEIPLQDQDVSATTADPWRSDAPEPPQLPPSLLEQLLRDQSESKFTSPAPSTSYSPTTPPPDTTVTSGCWEDYAVTDLAAQGNWTAQVKEEDSQQADPGEGTSQQVQCKEEPGPQSSASWVSESMSDEDVVIPLEITSVEYEPPPSVLAALDIMEFRQLLAEMTPERAQVWRRIRAREKHRLSDTKWRSARREKRRRLQQELEKSKRETTRLRVKAKKLENTNKNLIEQMLNNNPARRGRQPREGSRRSERLRQRYAW